MTAANFPTGHVFKDTYRVERLLGAGGMGVVYEVTHLRVGRRFALKVLSPGCAPDSGTLARFRREAEVMGHIDHPNIVGVVDFDCTPDGTHFLVMELLAGHTLERVLAHQVALTLEHVADIAGQVASALEAAHRAGVIHRDLKPENIMLCDEGGREVAKVLDFGLSKLLSATTALTQTAVTFGTPQYMSPEQALEASAVDQRSDIFSLGAIVYHMLSGRPPFHGSSVPTVLFKVVYEEPESLESVRPELPVAVIAVVERALRKKPEERFRSAVELAQALSAAVARAEEGHGVATEVALQGVLTQPVLDLPRANPAPFPPTVDAEGREAPFRDTARMEAQGGLEDPATPGGDSVAEAAASPAPDPETEEVAVAPRSPGTWPSVTTMSTRVAAPRATWRMGLLLALGVALSGTAVWLALRSGATAVTTGTPARAPGPEAAPSPVLAAGQQDPDAGLRAAARDAALPAHDGGALRAVPPLFAKPRKRPRVTPRSPRPKDTAHRHALSPVPSAETRTAALRVSVSDEKDRSLAATVLVDGKRYRCCPLEGLPRLTVGQTYALEVRCDGFESATGRIRIADGENRRHFALHPLTRRSAP